MNSPDGTQEVAQLKPNAWGLYDMSGNVFELCWDAANSDQQRRIRRGGSWFNGEPLASLSTNNWGFADTALIYVGFRVVRSVHK